MPHAPSPAPPLVVAFATPCALLITSIRSSSHPSHPISRLTLDCTAPNASQASRIPSYDPHHPNAPTDPPARSSIIPQRIYPGHRSRSPASAAAPCVFVAASGTGSGPRRQLLQRGFGGGPPSHDARTQHAGGCGGSRRLQRGRASVHPLPDVPERAPAGRAGDLHIYDAAQQARLFVYQHL